MAQKLRSYPDLSFHVSPVSPTQTTIFHKGLVIEASPRMLWEILTTPNWIPRWQYRVKQVVDYPDALQDASNRVGCEQRLLLKDGRRLIRMITDWKPGGTLGYALVEGSLYKGIQAELEIEVYQLDPAPEGGTEVRFFSVLEFDKPRLSEAFIRRFNRENRTRLNFLKWLAEHTRHDLSPGDPTAAHPP